MSRQVTVGQCVRTRVFVYSSHSSTVASPWQEARAYKVALLANMTAKTSMDLYWASYSTHVTLTIRSLTLPERDCSSKALLSFASDVSAGVCKRRGMVEMSDNSQKWSLRQSSRSWLCFDKRPSRESSIDKSRNDGDKIKSLHFIIERFIALKAKLAGQQ